MAMLHDEPTTLAMIRPAHVLTEAAFAALAGEPSLHFFTIPCDNHPIAAPEHLAISMVFSVKMQGGAVAGIRPSRSSFLLLETVVQGLGNIHELTRAILNHPPIERLQIVFGPDEPINQKAMPITQADALAFIAAATHGQEYHREDLEDPFPLLMAVFMCLMPPVVWAPRLNKELGAIGRFYIVGGAHSALAENHPMEISQRAAGILGHLLAFYLFKGRPNQLAESVTKRLTAYGAQTSSQQYIRRFFTNEAFNGQFPLTQNILTSIGDIGTANRALKDIFVRVFYVSAPTPASMLQLTQQLTEDSDIHTFLLAIEFKDGEKTLAHVIPKIRAEFAVLEAAQAALGDDYLRRHWPLAFGVAIPRQNEYKESAALAVYLKQQAIDRPNTGFMNYRGVVERGDVRFRAFAKITVTGGISYQDLAKFAEDNRIDIQRLVEMYNAAARQHGFGVPLDRPGDAMQH